MRSFVSKISNKTKAFYAMAMCTIMTAMCMGTNYCYNVNLNASTQSVLGGIIGIIVDIAKYVGIAIAAGGILSLVMAYKDDNGATRSMVKSYSIC